MKVILLKELKGKGGEGDVIDVAAGYANNYLLTQGYAVRATRGNLKQLEERRKNIEKREEVRLADAHKLEEALTGKHIKVDAQVGGEGQLFGSVTSQAIAEAIKRELDIEVDRRRIDIAKPIKTAGVHEVSISIYRDIKATISVLVGVDSVPGAAEEAAMEDVEAIEMVAEAIEAADPNAAAMVEELAVAGAEAAEK